MLSARAYSFRMKSRLAISLSWVGGYVNVIGWMFCGSAVSHMSGNATHLGQSIAALLESLFGGSGSSGESRFGGLMYFGSLVVCFLIGAASSGLMTEWARRRASRSKFILPMAVECLALGAFTIGVNFHIVGISAYELYLLTGIAAFAMACPSPLEMPVINQTFLFMRHFQ